MAKFQYEGESELVFPTLGLTVKAGDIIDAPEGFSHPDFTISSGKAAKAADKASTAAEAVVVDSSSDSTL
jgi:hypothetical protein